MKNFARKVAIAKIRAEDKFSGFGLVRMSDPGIVLVYRRSLAHVDLKTLMFVQ